MDTVLGRLLQDNGCSTDLSPRMERIMDERNVLSLGQVRHVQLSPKISERVGETRFEATGNERRGQTDSRVLHSKLQQNWHKMPEAILRSGRVEDGSGPRVKAIVAYGLVPSNLLPIAVN